MFSTKYDKVKKIWSGETGSGPLFHENASAGRVILYLLNLNQNSICQINADDGSKRTNGEIHDAALKIAVNLRRKDCEKGDVVGFVCKNSHDLTPALLATMFLGAPANILDVCFTKDMYVHSFRTTSPKFIFCDDNVAATVKESLMELDSNARIIVLGEKIPNLDHISDFLNEKELEAEIMELIRHPPEVDKRSCAAILCSSGSTGPSKCIAVSHETIKMIQTQLTNRIIKANSLSFSSASLFWANGNYTLFVSLLFGLQRVFTAKPFSPELMLTIVRQYRITYLFSSFIQVSRLADCELLKDSLGSVERIHVFGNNLSNDLANRIKKHMPTNGILSVTYGLTETGYISYQDKPSVKNGAGYLMSNVMVKILDDNGKQLGVGESGEICTKTDTLFLEYYRNTEATRKTLDEDGWLHTGDIGYLDEEGILFIIGRKKDLLRYNYFHVNATEIEEVLQAHPGILYASVIGIPDEHCNDLVTGVVVRKVRKSGCIVTEQEVIEFLETKVEGFKRLRGGVFFVEELPMTVSGKVNRNKVKEMILNLIQKQ